MARTVVDATRSAIRGGRSEIDPRAGHQTESGSLCVGITMDLRHDAAGRETVSDAASQIWTAGP